MIGPQLQTVLARYGLGDLAPWLSEMIVSNASDAEIELGLREQPAFRNRFWMIFEREKEGFPPISPDEVLVYEATVLEGARALGATVSREQIGRLIANNVSARESLDRVGIAATAVYQSPPETRAALGRLYGVTHADMVDYFLDPKETAPVLQRRFTAAQIAAEAERVGFAAQLSAGQAEGLAEAGVTAAGAREGFGRLVESEELFESVDRTETDIGVDDQLSLLTGNVELAEEVARRGERRAARFAGGGGFTTSREGMSGLGSAAR